MRGLDWVGATFDNRNLVANAGLLLVATVSTLLGVGRIVEQLVGRSGRVGSAPTRGRKVLIGLLVRRRDGNPADRLRLSEPAPPIGRSSGQAPR